MSGKICFSAVDVNLVIGRHISDGWKKCPAANWVKTYRVAANSWKILGSLNRRLSFIFWLIARLQVMKWRRTKDYAVCSSKVMSVRVDRFPTS